MMKPYYTAPLILLLASGLTVGCRAEDMTGTAEETRLDTTATRIPPTATTPLPPRSTTTPPPPPSATPTETATAPPTATITAIMIAIKTQVPTTTVMGPPYKVINVPANEMLIVHSGAGDEHLVLGEIPPDGRDIYLQGEPVLLGVTEWVLIRYETIIGWVKTFNLVMQ